jgi:hypothetical protein
MLLLELKELKGHKELKGLKVFKARLGQRVLEVQTVLREHKEHKEPWDLLVISDSKVLKAVKVFRVQEDLKEVKVLKA